MKLSTWVGFVTVFSVFSGTAALAHHSGAMFDNTREIQVAGTVHLLEWTYPHIIEVMADGPDGPCKFIIEDPRRECSGGTTGNSSRSKDSGRMILSEGPRQCQATRL